MDERTRRTTAPVTGRPVGRRRAPAADTPGAGAWCLAATGLLVAAVLGSGLVTGVLVESTADAAPTPATPATAERTPVDPGLLRLWGLRTGAGGGLTPSTSDDPVPATPLEELYATLRPAR